MDNNVIDLCSMEIVSTASTLDKDTGSGSTQECQTCENLPYPAGDASTRRCAKQNAARKLVNSSSNNTSSGIS